MLAIGLFCIYFIAACLFIHYLNSPSQAQWWVKILTEKPKCIYYFGPFLSADEAEGSQADYSQDIREEGSEIIGIKIEQCQPQKLTICEEELEEFMSIER